jgi:phosphate transport system permease protein
VTTLLPANAPTEVIAPVAGPELDPVPDAAAPVEQARPVTQAGPRTVLPARLPASDAPETRRAVSGVRFSDLMRLIGAAAASFALTWWIFSQLLPLQGVLGFIATTFVLFVIIFGVLVSLDESGPTVKDRVLSVFVHAIGVLMLLALSSVVVFTIVRGWDALFHGNFWIMDMSATGPLDGLDSGGILYAIIGTLIMIGIALAISVPLGILTAVFLSEVPGRYAKFVRTVVEAMTALPSIVAGLFIYASVVLILGFDRSGFAASLAMTVMMLPIIIRSADVVLRLVPGNLKEASLALGASQWRTVWNVTLPTARSGLTTAVILGTARGIGETSPVLLTAGTTTFFNFNPFSGPMVSLPLATFNFVKSPEPSMIARGFGTAVVLMLLVIVLFAMARVIGGRGAGVLSPRQLRKRRLDSVHDLERITRGERAEAERLAAEQASIAAATAAATVETQGYTGMGFVPTRALDEQAAAAAARQAEIDAVTQAAAIAAAEKLVARSKRGRRRKDESE